MATLALCICSSANADALTASSLIPNWTELTVCTNRGAWNENWPTPVPYTNWETKSRDQTDNCSCGCLPTSTPLHDFYTCQMTAESWVAALHLVLIRTRQGNFAWIVCAGPPNSLHTCKVGCKSCNQGDVSSACCDAICQVEPKPG